jgi:hypothetical protein
MVNAAASRIAKILSIMVPKMEHPDLAIGNFHAISGIYLWFMMVWALFAGANKYSKNGGRCGSNRLTGP